MLKEPCFDDFLIFFLSIIILISTPEDGGESFLLPPPLAPPLEATPRCCTDLQKFNLRLLKTFYEIKM